MSDADQIVPVIEERARVITRATDIERVRVRAIPEVEDVILREQVMRDSVEVVRVPVDRAVDETPQIRTEGDVTIVPVVEERLVVEKRLFLVEELHIHRRPTREAVEIPATLRRTRVEITRDPIDQQEDH